MTTTHLIPPLTDAQQIAAALGAAAARQPNMPLIRAAVATRHPHLTEDEQDALAERVASEMPRALVTVGFPVHTVRPLGWNCAAGAVAAAGVMPATLIMPAAAA